MVVTCVFFRRPADQHVRLNFNDVGKDVDRRSYERIYDVVHGIPRYVTIFFVSSFHHVCLKLDKTAAHSNYSISL